MADDAGANDPKSQPHPSSLPAALLTDILNTLNEDDRLKAIFAGPPIEALVVAAEGGAITIDPAPGIDIGLAENEILRAAVRDATAEARMRRSARSEDVRDVGAASPRPHIIAARAHLDSGNPGRALDVVDAALPRWPDSAELVTYRALALAALGHHAQAVDAYREVIRHDPESVFAHVGAAQLLADAHQWDQALAYASSALALDPDDAASLHVSALANEQLGLHQEAYDAMRRALAADPDIPGGAETLGRIERASMHEGVEVTLVESAPIDTAEEVADVEVELADPAPPEEEPAAAEPPPESDDAGDARWAVPAHRVAQAERKKCENCGALNPTHVAFCIECGNRM